MTSSRNQLTARRRSLVKVGVPCCLLLAASLALSACKPAAKPVANGDPVGVYTLVSVDGKKLPATVMHEGTSLQVRSGRFTISADGTCGSLTTFVPPSGTEVTREVSANFTREGSKLSMQWKGAGTTTGTLDGDTFTMNNEGMVFAYKR